MALSFGFLGVAAVAGFIMGFVSGNDEGNGGNGDNAIAGGAGAADAGGVRNEGIFQSCCILYQSCSRKKALQCIGAVTALLSFVLIVIKLVKEINS